MLDRIVAVLAFAALAGFLGIFIYNVPRPALVLVTAFVLALVAWDFWGRLNARRNNGGR